MWTKKYHIYSWYKKKEDKFDIHKRILDWKTDCEQKPVVLLVIIISIILKFIVIIASVVFVNCFILTRVNIATISENLEKSHVF